MCEIKGCPRPRCRELSHHGVTVTADQCPACKGERHGALLDLTHAVGVLHSGSCGTYFIPATTPPSMLADAEPWELGWWSNHGCGMGAPGELVKRAPTGRRISKAA